MNILADKPMNLRITIMVSAVVFCISISAGLLHFFLTKSLVQRQNIHGYENLVRLAMTEAKESAEKSALPHAQWKHSAKGNIFILNATGQILWVNEKKLSLTLKDKLKDSLQSVDLEIARGLFQANKAKIAAEYARANAPSSKDELQKAYFRDSGKDKILFYSPVAGLYALTEMPEMHMSVGILLATIFIISLLITALVSVIIWHLSSGIANALLNIGRGIEVESLIPEAIETPYMEVQELVRVVSDNLQFSGSLPQGKDTLEILQKKLFEKPFGKLKKFEVIVFPKNPSPGSENFLAAIETSGRLQFFAGRFDVQETETLVIKHRLQERFMGLTRHISDASILAESMWSAFFQHVDLGPGLLYLDIDPQQSGLHYFRSGPYYVFSISTQNEHLDDGDTFFSSRFSGFHTHETSPGSATLIISKETTEAVELSPEEILPLLGKYTSGKMFLGNLLEKLHKRLQTGESLTGLVALIVNKK